MNQTERHKLYRQVLWDYNIDPEAIDNVLSGRIEKAGHFDCDAIMARLLESYSWFTILQPFSPAELNQMITDETIKQLRSATLRKQYEFVQKRLQKLVPGEIQ